MSIRFTAIIGAVLLLLCGPGIIWADDAPVKSVGKTIQPRNDVPVRMVSEEVRIWLNSTRADVHCLFTLQNEGRPDTIEVGFPRGWESDLIGFTARVDGRTIPVESMAEQPSCGEFIDGKLPWWKVFNVPFTAAMPIREIRNEYSTFLLPGGEEELSDLHFTYILKTGALWKGPVGDAGITLFLNRMPFEQISKISPEGYVREGNRISWRFTDFEPEQNIEISIIPDILHIRREIARKLVEKEPDNSYAHFLLGSVYYHRDLTKAVEELQKAIVLDPRNWDARWFLALTCICLNYSRNDLKDAGPQLDAILSGNPGYRCTDRLFYRDDMFYDDNPGDLLKRLKKQGWK